MRQAWVLPVLSLLASLTVHADEPDQTPPPASSGIWKPRHIEGYAGLYTGSFAPDTNAATATTQCFLFCVPITATHEVRYNDGKAQGLRAGLWLGDGRIQGGVGFELMHAKADGDLAKTNFTGVNLTPMARVRLLTPARFPALSLHGYGGLLLGAVRDGEIRIYFPEFTAAASGALEGRQHGVLAGVSLTVRSLVFQMETRTVSGRLKSEYLGDSGRLDMSGRQTLGGLVWRF